MPKRVDLCKSQTETQALRTLSGRSERWAVGDGQRGPGRGPPGWALGCRVVRLVFCPLHQAWPVWLCARLPVVPASCSLDGGPGGRGEGVLVAHQCEDTTLNGDPLSSPHGLQLCLPLFAGGGRGFWKGDEPLEVPKWGRSSSSAPIPHLNSSPHSRLPASPDQPLAPALRPHVTPSTTTSTLIPLAAEAAWCIAGAGAGGAEVGAGQETRALGADVAPRWPMPLPLRWPWANLWVSVVSSVKWVQ